MSRKNLLAYHLDQYENSFLFKIVEQDDKVTNFIKRVGVYEAPNGWRICIDRQPEIDIDNKVIYLRGKRTTKDGYMHRNQEVGSPKEVKKLIGAINKAIEDMVREAKCGTRRPFKLYDQMIIDLSQFDPFYPVRQDNRIIIIK